VFRTVTLPLIVPGLAGGAAFAFITSFDEVVVSIFLAGVQAKTLPVKLWETIRVEFTPGDRRCLHDPDPDHPAAVRGGEDGGARRAHQDGSRVR
jgi:hypothetical protein